MTPTPNSDSGVWCFSTKSPDSNSHFQFFNFLQLQLPLVLRCSNLFDFFYSNFRFRIESIPLKIYPGVLTIYQPRTSIRTPSIATRYTESHSKTTYHLEQRASNCNFFYTNLTLTSPSQINTTAPSHATHAFERHPYQQVATPSPTTTSKGLLRRQSTPTTTEAKFYQTELDSLPPSRSTHHSLLTILSTTPLLPQKNTPQTTPSTWKPCPFVFRFCCGHCTTIPIYMDIISQIPNADFPHCNNAEGLVEDILLHIASNIWCSYEGLQVLDFHSAPLLILYSGTWITYKHLGSSGSTLKKHWPSPSAPPLSKGPNYIFT